MGGREVARFQWIRMGRSTKRVRSSLTWESTRDWQKCRFFRPREQRENYVQPFNCDVCFQRPAAAPPTTKGERNKQAFYSSRGFMNICGIKVYPAAIYIALQNVRRRRATPPAAIVACAIRAACHASKRTGDDSRSLLRGYPRGLYNIVEIGCRDINPVRHRRAPPRSSPLHRNIPEIGSTPTPRRV